MKKLLKIMLVTATVAAAPCTVFAVEDFPTPEYSSKSLVTDEGLSDVATFNFDEGQIDISSKELVLMVNGEFVPYKGVMSNGVTFVPVRVISESFGKEVKWDADSQKVTVENIELTIGSKTALVGGTKVELQAAPFVQGGTTYVPLRFIAENLDKEVGYVQKNNDLLIQNSMVWVEEKGKSDNDGKTVEEVKEWLQDAIYANENFFDLHGNSDGFTEEAVENLEYEGQLGRYAIFDHSTIQEVILVDMENESVYFYHKEPGFSYVQVQIKDGEYFIYEADVSVKLPEEFEGKFVIGSAEREYVSENNLAKFDIYHKGSYEVPLASEEDFRYGYLFSISAWNKEYSTHNPPFRAGGWYDLFSTKDANYMINFPSGFEGYEPNEALTKEYLELSTFAMNERDAMRDSIKPISTEVIPLEYKYQAANELFLGTWVVDKFLGFGESYNDDTEQPNGYDIVGKTVVMNADGFSTESFAGYPEFQYKLDWPDYQVNNFGFENAGNIDFGVDENSEILEVDLNGYYEYPPIDIKFYIIDSERVVMRVGERTWYELKKVKEASENPYELPGIQFFPEVNDFEPSFEVADIAEYQEEEVYNNWTVNKIATFATNYTDVANYPKGLDIKGKEVVMNKDLFSTMSFEGYQEYQKQISNPEYKFVANFNNEASLLEYEKIELPNMRTEDWVQKIAVYENGLVVPNISYYLVSDGRMYMALDCGIVYELGTNE